MNTLLGIYKRQLAESRHHRSMTSDDNAPITANPGHPHTFVAITMLNKQVVD